MIPFGFLKTRENTQAARQIWFTNVREIVEMESILKAYIYEAIEVEKAGLKVNFKKTILQNYRAKSDELEIGSPRRIHVRRLHHSNHSVWRWRVFLPEGQFYYLHVATKGAMDDKLPPPDQSGMFDGYGEVIVNVFAADSITAPPTTTSTSLPS